MNTKFRTVGGDAWVGTSEAAADTIGPQPARLLAATLEFSEGDRSHLFGSGSIICQLPALRNLGSTAIQDAADFCRRSNCCVACSLECTRCFYARDEEGYPDLVVHGPLTVIVVTQFASDDGKRPGVIQPRCALGPVPFANRKSRGITALRF